jgi:hypothetical protein
VVEHDMGEAQDLITTVRVLRDHRVLIPPRRIQPIRPDLATIRVDVSVEV